MIEELIGILLKQGMGLAQILEFLDKLEGEFITLYEDRKKYIFPAIQALANQRDEDILKGLK